LAVSTLTSGTAGTTTSTSATYTYRAESGHTNGQVARIDYNLPAGQTASSDYVAYSGWSGATDQPTAIRQRDGTTLAHTYNAKGEITSTSGGGATPVTSSTNNVTGVSTLTTYKDGSFGNNGTANAATTTWQVDPNTGRMVSKTYADNSSVGYSYNAAGQLAQSTFGGVAATYGYTADGIRNAVTYEESNQPTICYATQAFDAWGNPLVITETTTPVYWFGVHTVAEAFSYDAVRAGARSVWPPGPGGGPSSR
jgi:YD repeat-containing protein